MGSEGAAVGSHPDPREWLSGVALDLYQHLDAVGEIARLKQMPHLGPVAWVHPEVNHTRWDYVHSMLRLAARIAPLDSLFEDYGKVEIDGHWVGAGRDVLQCWAMLLDQGSLWGSPATGRLVLDALVRSRRTRELFLRGFPTDLDTAYAAWVVDHYRVNPLGAVLGIGFIHLLPEHRSSPNRPLWLAMLRGFFNHDLYGQKVAQLWRIYGQLRWLTQLFLDLRFAHLPVTVDLSAVERDPARHLGDLVLHETGPLRALLEHAHRYLSWEIYLAPEVVLAYRLLQERDGARIRAHLAAAESPEQLFARMAAMKTPDAWPAVADVAAAVERRDYVHLHRVHRLQHVGIAYEAFSAQIPRLQARLTRRLGAESLVHVAAVYLDERSEHLIDFYVRPVVAAGDLARTLTVVCEQVTQAAPSSGRSGAPRLQRGPEVRALVSALLSLMLHDAKRLRARKYPELKDDDAFLLLRPRDQGAAQREIARLMEILKEGPRRHELGVLDASLRARPIQHFRAVMLGGFEVERKAEGSPGDAEFDGAYVDIAGEGATLYIVEAKSTLDSQAAVRQLRRRLRRLGWIEGAQVVPITGGAEASVPIWLRGCC